MPLVLRQTKGSPLTTAEMDGNLTFLKNRTQAYASVAAMKADADLVVDDVVQTAGYTTPGDGGGATYQIVSGSEVIGYDEPNIQAYNLFSGAQTTLNGWDRTGIAAYGSGSSDNALIAPDGTVSADYIAETAVGGYHGVNRQSSNTTASFQGPQEFYVHAAKPSLGANARQYVNVAIHVGKPSTASPPYYPWNYPENRVTAIIDLNSATAVYTLYGADMTNPSTVVTDLGTGWVRIGIRYTPPTNLTGWVNPSLGPAISATPGTYTGDTSKGAYFWGWGIRPLTTPGIALSNTLQAKPLLSNTVRLSQFGAATNTDNNALLKALSYFGANPGTLIIDAPTVFTQPASLTTLTIPSNVSLRFEGSGALTGVTNLTVNSQLIADNRAILPKYTSVTFGPRQRSVLSNWFGL